LYIKRVASNNKNNAGMTSIRTYETLANTRDIFKSVKTLLNGNRKGNDRIVINNYCLCDFETFDRAI